MNFKVDTSDNLTFNGYKSPLKDLYKQGKLPTVKYGFYGDQLDPENVSLEHLKPHSKGGPTVLWNLVLASKDKNMQRGNDAFINFFNPKTARRYLDQFTNIVVHYMKGTCKKVFIGNRYKKDIIKTINKLGGNLDTWA